MKRWLWNHLLVPVLDLVCRAEKTILTAPTGNIEISLCDGWCHSWKIESHGLANCGLSRRKFFDEVLPAYERRLRTEGKFEDADLLYGVLTAMAPDA